MSLWEQWSVRFLIAGSLDRWIAGSTGRGVDTVAGGCVD